MAATGTFDYLQAEEAWIAGTTFKDGAVQARHHTVTEDFLAKITQFIEVWADKFWANQAFVDRMAAFEGYFGSEECDYRTRNDGIGVTIWGQVEDEQQLTTRLEPSENALSFFEERINHHDQRIHLRRLHLH